MKIKKYIMTIPIIIFSFANISYAAEDNTEIEKAPVEWNDDDIRAVEDLNDQLWKDLYPILDGVEEQEEMPQTYDLVPAGMGGISAGDFMGNPGSMQTVNILGHNYAYFNQGDFGGGIASSGCGPTSISILLSNITGQPYSPVKVFNTAVSRGICSVEYGSDGDGLAGMMSGLGYPTRRTYSLNEVINWLKQGYVAYAGVSGTDYYNGRSLAPWFHFYGGHFVALAGISSNNEFVVLDPGWRQYTGLISANRVHASAKAYWLVQAKSL